MITWSGRNLNLPVHLPDHVENEVVSPYRFVQYYNTCTFGHSTAFWDWERWKREIDWMALHGINMPLAMEGQEAVWQSVWHQIGLPQREIDLFSVGPAYLPWFRMGNISRSDGPLPHRWIDQKALLQRKILDRMRELDMSPVVPAFSGFVPDVFMRMRPAAKTFTLLWTPEMPRLSRAFILDPNDLDGYREIGGRFIREHKKTFGDANYFLADAFNEMHAPVGSDNRYEDLARFSRAVFEGILAGDAQGVWVMQGWLFRNQPEFWDIKSIAASLSPVPDDRMIIIDFSNDAYARSNVKDPTEGNTWKSCGSFLGKQWINGMIHTLGGNNTIKGNLPLISQQPAAVLASAEKKNLVGWGMDPEGIENNEVVYELMTDIGWSASSIDLQSWIPAYCRARYGAYPPEMATAWTLLLASTYSWHPTWNSRQAWQCRPSLDPVAKGVESGPQFEQAVDSFLACAEQLSGKELYENDLIELTAQACGGWVDRRLQAACVAHRAGRSEDRDGAAKEALDMLLRIDSLMNARPDRRLETWTGRARKWADGPLEEAYYDSDSRRVITCWGWAEVYDYASRVYAGLIRDYYPMRWKVFFAGLQQEKPPSLDVWEETWLSFSLQAISGVPRSKRSGGGASHAGHLQN
jgi:alpha-N-acetylglucosaminidase